MRNLSTFPTPTRPTSGWPLGAAAVLVLGGVLAGCGADSDSGGSTEDSAAGPTTTGAPEPGSPVASAPGADAGEPVCEDGTFDGRGHILCIADTADEEDPPGLVVALHGRGSSAEGLLATSELHTYAVRHGMAVAYPSGVDGRWGDDTFTTGGLLSGDEDLVYLDDLVADLRADPRIGDRPVGMVGFSNGGSMALRYAAQRPDGVTAVVSVAGQMPRDPSVRPTGRVPLLQIYGTGDPVRGYHDGIADTPDRGPEGPTPTLSTPETVAAFVAAGGEAPTHEGPVETDPDPGDETSLRTERWVDDRGTLAVLLTIVDGGHTWPSAHSTEETPPDFGPISRDVDAGEEAVAFILTATREMSAHPR